MLLAEQKKNAIEKLENWTCSICQDPAIIPIKIYKAQSKHMGLFIVRGDSVEQLFFYVPDSSLVDPSKLKLSYHFDGSTDEKKLMACCPICRNPSPVLKVEVFILGKMFSLFAEKVYEQIRELVKRAQTDSNCLSGECLWKDCPYFSASTADLVRHVFECQHRLFQCPIGRNPFQSHSPRDIECKQQFSLLGLDTKKPFLERYQISLRAHATISCITRVGSCNQCPRAPQNTAPYGVPACELKTHSSDHKKVDNFWDFIKLLAHDLFEYSSTVQNRPPLQASQLPSYEKAFDQFAHAFTTLVNLMMESGCTSTEAFRNRSKEVFKWIASGKAWDERRRTGERVAVCS